MKTKFKFIFLLLALGIIFSGEKTSAIEKTKEYHQVWKVSDVQTLQVINKFGEIKVINNPSGEITVDVKVIVGVLTESRVESLMKKINVEFSKLGSTAKAETTIESNFGGNQKLQINYLINIPSDKNLEISNKYGNTILNELKANGKFDIQYGNLSANVLECPKPGSIVLNLAYGKSTVGKAGDLLLNIKYSTSNFGDTKNLNINSAYSVLDFDNVENVKVEARYDTYSFEKVNALDANGRYSNFKAGVIAKRLNFDSAYGSIKAGEMSRDFESVVVNSIYGNVVIGLEGLSYSIDASCNYCGIRYEQEKFKGDRSKDDKSISIKGKVGSETGGTVKINSKYGEIKLVQ